jgi:hypothetical protein
MSQFEPYLKFETKQKASMVCVYLLSIVWWLVLLLWFIVTILVVGAIIFSGITNSLFFGNFFLMENMEKKISFSNFETCVGIKQVVQDSLSHWLNYKNFKKP